MTLNLPKWQLFIETFPILAFKTEITPDNVSRYLASLDLPEVIKILNLDIDSYDYFVLENY